MQDFLQGNFDETNEALERFSIMNSGDRELYFDVHQIESLFDFYIEEGQFDLAEKIITIGLKQHPNSLSLQVKSTIILSEQGFFDEALEILYQHQKIEQHSSEIYMSIGWILLKKGSIKEAINAFHSTLIFADDDRESFILDIGFSLNQEGFYDESLCFLEMGKQEFPFNENILFELAFAYDKTNQIESGIDAYIELLDLNPFFENTWYNLGTLYNKNNEFEKAIEAYDYSLAINPDHHESYFNMGNSYAHLGIFNVALDYYLEHASYGDDNIITYQYIGECWEQLNNHEMALRYYHLVLQINPQSSEAWYGIGTSLLFSRMYKESISSLTEAIKLNPENPDYYFAHARACYEIKQFRKAIQSLEKGISFDPEETSAWIELLQLHLKHSKNFDYITFINNALALYPTIGAVSYLAAIVYLKLACDRKLALAYLKVAKKRQPDDIQYVLAEFPELLTYPEISKYINKKVKNVK